MKETKRCKTHPKLRLVPVLLKGIYGQQAVALCLILEPLELCLVLVSLCFERLQRLEGVCREGAIFQQKKKSVIFLYPTPSINIIFILSQPWKLTKVREGAVYMGSSSLSDIFAVLYFIGAALERRLGSACNVSSQMVKNVRGVAMVWGVLLCLPVYMRKGTSQRLGDKV